MPFNYRQIMGGPETAEFLPQSWHAAPRSQRGLRSRTLTQDGHPNSGETCDSREPRFLLCFLSVILCGGAITTLARAREAPVGMSQPRANMPVPSPLCLWNERHRGDWRQCGREVFPKGLETAPHIVKPELALVTSRYLRLEK